MTAAGTTTGRARRITIVGALAMLWLAVVVIGGIFASLLTSYGPTQQDLPSKLQGPSGAHWLGTDTLGRDILTRLLYGARPTIVSILIAIGCYVVLGVVLGLAAGYLSGWTDRAISSATSVVIAMPHIIILFVVLSIFRGNTYIAMMLYGILSSPVMVLLVRSSALAVRNELFIDAARVSGLSSGSIIFKHILPRIRGLVIVQAAVFGATAIVVESALSFLGFGKQPPSPTWGNMVAEAATTISLHSWMLYPTGGVIALTALSLGVVGDMLRDAVAKSWTASKLTRDPRRTARIDRSAPSEKNLVEVAGLSVGYRSGRELVPIVSDVGFTIGRGQTVGLVGESGSGKTTVAFGVLGVTGDDVAITGGSVRFDGTNLVGLSGAELAAYRGKRIAYVAQEPTVALDPSYRIGAQLMEAVKRNDGLTGDAANKRVLELLAQVELPDPTAVFRKYPHELSGGMAQRVSIAFALAGRPELLVADEPTTALDVTVQAEILGLLMRLRDETGMSMLIITHDWGVIADVCDWVVVLYRGEVVEQATADEIFTRPRHPYTQALLASNPHGAEPGHDLPVITGDFPTPSQERAAAGERQTIGLTA